LGESEIGVEMVLVGGVLKGRKEEEISPSSTFGLDDYREATGKREGVSPV